MGGIRKFVLIGLLAALLPGRSMAEEGGSTEENCLSRFDQYTTGLMSILRALQPLTSSDNLAQRCAGWTRHIRAHQELAKKFQAEPAECRNSELGKTLTDTLQDVIRQGEADHRDDGCEPTPR